VPCVTADFFVSLLYSSQLMRRPAGPGSPGTGDAGRRPRRPGPRHSRNRWGM